MPDGNPDGLRIIEIPNRTISGVVFNRSIYKEARQREEFERAGVYVLVGQDEDSVLPKIYVGEAEVVADRLKSHYANKDFWDWAVFFTSKDETLNKAHVKYLESRLVGMAIDAKRAVLDNGKDSTKAKLSESEQADVESFLSDMLSIFPLLNLSVFEQIKKTPKSKKALLHISGRGIEGTGYEDSKGFVVCKGTQSPLTDTKSMHDFLKKERQNLIKNGVLVNSKDCYLFSQDYIFSSPSKAASIVLARNSNGRTAWKDKNGKTLKSIQEELVAK